jgi:hypothetical protein
MAPAAAGAPVPEIGHVLALRGCDRMRKSGKRAAEYCRTCIEP